MESKKEEILRLIEISRRKNWKDCAWNYAESALDLARKAGIDAPDDILGRRNYPELDALERLVRASSDYIIVSRHAGTVEWLRRQGIVGDVIQHVTDAAQVRGQHVVGALPLHLAVEAASISTIDMPLLPFERRGDDLSAEEMEQYGAILRRYQVRRV